VDVTKASMTTGYRAQVINAAADAALDLMKQLAGLLDLCTMFIDENTGPLLTRADKIKLHDLETVTRDIAELANTLSYQILAWKKNDLLLSDDGFEQNILNELFIVLKLTYVWFQLEDYDVEDRVDLVQGLEDIRILRDSVKVLNKV
jgi:hypothetical protein